MPQNKSNQAAIAVLKGLSFPLKNIRKSLHVLTGIGQTEVARRLNISRQSVTAHMDGTRNNPQTQASIAQIFGVNRDALFDPESEARP